MFRLLRKRFEKMSQFVGFSVFFPQNLGLCISRYIHILELSIWEKLATYELTMLKYILGGYLK